MKVFYSLLLMLTTHAISSNAQDPGFAWYDHTLPMEVRIDALVGAMTLEEKFSQLLDESAAIPRLDVPRYGWWNECLHGV